MPSASFCNTHNVWDEISVFAEASLARWAIDDFATQLPNDLELLGVQCPCLVLHDAGKHWQNLRTFSPHFKNYKPTTKFTFSERASAAKVSEYQVHYDDHFYISLQQIVFGHAFEKLRHHAEAKWGSRRNWPGIVQFGYHIRNASFHGNHFHFTQPIIGAPCWRGIKIAKTLDGHTVMGRSKGVIGFADIPLILYEIQCQL
jgi:hypothetical protein